MKIDVDPVSTSAMKDFALAVGQVGAHSLIFMGVDAAGVH
jgi:hypothetical protein